MSRPTNLLGYIQQLNKLPFISKLLNTQYVSNGIAGFVTDKTGNAYEIIIRPAAYAQVNWGKLIRKNEIGSNKMTTNNLIKEAVADAKAIRECIHSDVKRLLENEITEQVSKPSLRHLIQREIRKYTDEDTYEIDDVLDEDEFEDPDDFEHDESDWQNDLYADNLDDQDDGQNMTRKILKAIQDGSANRALEKAIKEFDKKYNDENDPDLDDILSELEADEEDQEFDLEQIFSEVDNEILEPVSQAGSLHRTKAKKRNQILADKQYNQWKDRYEKEQEENRMAEWRKHNKFWQTHIPFSQVSGRVVSGGKTIPSSRLREQINESIQHLENDGGLIIQKSVKKVVPNEVQKRKLMETAGLLKNKSKVFKNPATRIHQLSGQSKGSTVQQKIAQWQNDKKLLND